MRDPERILVVEDMPDWQGRLRDILEDEGYVVEMAASFGEALGELRRKSFDLVVVDLRLSLEYEENRSGVPLLEYVHDRQIPSIVVTGYGTVELAKEAYEKYGVFDFLDKASFDPVRFREHVKEAIASEPKSSSPLAAWIQKHTAGVIDNIIATIVVGIAAWVIGSMTGWLPSNPLYVTASIIVMALFFVASIAWQRRRK